MAQSRDIEEHIRVGDYNLDDKFDVEHFQLTEKPIYQIKVWCKSSHICAMQMVYWSSSPTNSNQKQITHTDIHGEIDPKCSWKEITLKADEYISELFIFYKAGTKEMSGFSITTMSITSPLRSRKVLFGGADPKTTKAGNYCFGPGSFGGFFGYKTKGDKSRIVSIGAYKSTIERIPLEWVRKSEEEEN